MKHRIIGEKLKEAAKIQVQDGWHPLLTSQPSLWSLNTEGQVLGSLHQIACSLIIIAYSTVSSLTSLEKYHCTILLGSVQK